MVGTAGGQALTGQSMTSHQFQGGNVKHVRKPNIIPPKGSMFTEFFRLPHSASHCRSPILIREAGSFYPSPTGRKKKSDPSTSVLSHVNTGYPEPIGLTWRTFYCFSYRAGMMGKALFLALSLYLCIHHENWQKTGAFLSDVFHLCLLKSTVPTNSRFPKEWENTGLDKTRRNISGVKYISTVQSFKQITWQA